MDQEEAIQRANDRHFRFWGKCRGEFERIFCGKLASDFEVIQEQVCDDFGEIFEVILEMSFEGDFGYDCSKILG
jgi:hypothetical protein